MWVSTYFVMVIVKRIKYLNKVFIAKDMIDDDTLNKIHEMLSNNRFDFDRDAEIDILKQGYNWSKDFIIECLKKGKVYKGSELYPDLKKRHERCYCIHKPNLLSSKLILIGFLIFENILIIHISPLNRGSKEGKIYYNLSDL